MTDDSDSCDDLPRFYIAAILIRITCQYLDTCHIDNLPNRVIKVLGIDRVFYYCYVCVDSK